MEHYFFSYLLTWEVDFIEILEIMAQMWQYVIFLSLKPTKVTSDFILYQLKKVVGGATTQKYQKQMLKPWYFLYGSAPRGPRGVKRCARIHWTCHVRFGALILPPNWRILKKVYEIRCFLTFFSNFDDISKFVSFWSNLSAKTQQFYL